MNESVKVRYNKTETFCKQIFKHCRCNSFIPRQTFQNIKYILLFMYYSILSLLLLIFVSLSITWVPFCNNYLEYNERVLLSWAQFSDYVFGNPTGSKLNLHFFMESWVRLLPFIMLIRSLLKTLVLFRRYPSAGDFNFMFFLPFCIWLWCNRNLKFHEQ